MSGPGRVMASKGPEAFRTISEVADDLDLPQHVLRFWETRFTQIKPMKRGGGRRYYRPDDVDLLRSIRHLLYNEGYTIRGVQRILKEQGPRAVVGLMRTPASAPPLARNGAAPPFKDEDEEIELEAEEEDELDEADEDAGEDEQDSDADSDGDDADEVEDEADDDAEGDDEDDSEPSFDPREFREERPATPANGVKARQVSALSGEDVRRLQATITDLLELKRLLDQARG